TVLFTLTSVVVLVITTDWISWDKLNRGFLPSDEVSRAFLASFILVFDLLIVMQTYSKTFSWLDIMKFVRTNLINTKKRRVLICAYGEYTDIKGTGYSLAIMHWQGQVTIIPEMLHLTAQEQTAENGASESKAVPFLADLCIKGATAVEMDWEFPHFMGDVEVNLPGLPSAHMQFKVPYFQKVLKEEYHIHITDEGFHSYVICVASSPDLIGYAVTVENFEIHWVPSGSQFSIKVGKWFNYGIIFLVLILDLNMWKNQIFYKPHEYGQYIGPGQKIYTVKDSESLKDLNRTKLSWEWRSNNTNPLTNRTYAEGDMFLHSRYIGSSLDVKCLAFIPSLLAFALFGFFIWFFGRFQKTDQGMENLDKSYTRMKRKSPSDMGMTRENTQVLVEEPLSFQEPHLVSIKSDLSEIVFNSSLLTSENLNAQLSEQDSPLQPVPESSVPKGNPTT
ncbi:hypothetical protein ASZ78_005216, partial [Callipepla squamata]